jgi:hypothetical protein
MKCDKCGYSDNGTGDWAHVCVPVKVKHYSNTNNPIDFPKSDEMNERIRELADKIWAEEYWDNPNTDKLLPAQLNKFAELIIREAADIATINAHQWHSPGRFVLTYFGLEE